MLATWPTTRLAEQTVVVPVDEGAVGSVTPEVAAGAGGVILFGRQAPAGLGSSLAALRRAAPGGIAPLVMTDEEGGAVQRMANLVGSLPSARQMGATMTPAQIQALARSAGLRMRAAGVTMDLAPVLDLDGGPGPSASDAIGTRSFGTSPQAAAVDALAFAAGLRQAGVIPVVKHFPGLGGARGNSDLGPVSTAPWSSLAGTGLRPFSSAVQAGMPAVMVANATVPGLTTGPASLAPAAIGGVLRGRLGFSGLVLTDSLSAGAVSAAGYSVPRAAVAALAAGADMVLYTATAASVAGLTRQTVDAVTAAVASGRLPRSRLQGAVLHVLAAKHVALCR
ncbi:MAG: glycoside hydrolase family 3 N-terminal domain-containing protein [Blastococcus sp.]